MEKIAVETEIWPADVKYAEEITEKALQNLAKSSCRECGSCRAGKRSA